MACRMVALHDFTTWFVLYATSRLLNDNHLVILWKMFPLEVKNVGEYAQDSRYSWCARVD
jgi:hypothetical protein